MIVNPHAGKKHGTAVAEKARIKLEKHNFSIDTFISREPGESVNIASSINIDNYKGILAVGGDGTLFEVINGLLKYKEEITVPIAQIPVGTGNSFTKDLGITNMDNAIDAVIRGNSREIDLGEFNCNQGKYFFSNILGTGFVSNVAHRANKYKWLGSLSYILGVIEEVTVLKSTQIELSIDGDLIQRDAIFTEVCNSRYTGGDMLMAPDAKIDDGLLDIIVLNKVSRRKLLSLFPLLFKGKHIMDKSVEVFTGKNISLKSSQPLALTPDGETFGETPIEIKLHSKKIKMFC